MKKIILMTFLMVGMTVLAQERNRKPLRDKMEQFTPEQRSQLMLKKMSLELDLNDSQQKDMSAMIADMSAKKEAHKTAMKAMKEKGVKPTSDERFAMKMKMLDEQIAMKKRMEKILNPKQFEKWNEMKERHMADRKENRPGKHQGKRQGKHPQNPQEKG
jgi:protein CpxP